MSDMNIIFAPHVDDEIIGCWSVLRSSTRLLPTKVMYLNPIDDRRWAEAQRASKRLGFQLEELGAGVNSIDGLLWTCRSGSVITKIYAPDPYWELHPLHKEVGSLVKIACQKYRLRFFTYSTNMNCPYLRELSKVEKNAKRMNLDRCYPSQKTLWQHDFRYWMFEGISEWILNPD